jgi:pimeloyl-ACP methyl ester carboxylesterase
VTVHARSSFIEVDGHRLHCVSAGAGAPVVLLHGYGVSGAYMLPLARVLSRSFSVFVPDLPGCGKSCRSRTVLGVGELAGLVGDLLGVLEVTAPTIVANSFGCQIATALAIERPQSVGALVLIGPTVDPKRRSGRRQLLSALRALTSEPESLIIEGVRGTKRQTAFDLIATARVILADRIEDRLPLVTQPSVVVVGERDAFVDAAWGRRAAELLPDGMLVTVPGAPHAVHYTDPDLIAGLVRRLELEEGSHRSGEFVGSLEHRHVPAFEENEPSLRDQPLPLPSQA